MLINEEENTDINTDEVFLDCVASVYGKDSNEYIKAAMLVYYGICMGAEMKK